METCISIPAISVIDSVWPLKLPKLIHPSDKLRMPGFGLLLNGSLEIGAPEPYEIFLIICKVERFDFVWLWKG